MKCVWTPRRSGGKYILAALAVAAFATFGRAQDQAIPLPFPPAAPRIVGAAISRLNPMAAALGGAALALLALIGR